MTDNIVEPRSLCIRISILVGVCAGIIGWILLTPGHGKKYNRNMARHVQFNSQLSDVFTRLWELDKNRCKPDVDYRLDLQGYVTSTNLGAPDRAKRNLFAMLNENSVFSRPTYNSFRALLDNYESETNQPETVSAEEEKENWRFIELICATPVMAEAHRFLAAERKVSSDLNDFKRLLYDIWFKLYKRTREDSSINSCGFEHVFVGETRGHEVSGFHNWIQFYLQEKAGHIDYRGYFRRGTTEEMEKSPRIMTLQFTWNKDSGKPIGSSFIGTSPEFEVALYTVCFLMNQEKVLVKIKVYDIELTCFRHGRGIGTAFPVSKAD